VADKLGDNNYDAIYASTMVRTQLTAAPMSQRLGLPIQVLPGLQEIEAGVFEGTPEANAAGGYGLYPIAWALPGAIPQIPFDKSTYMPGTNLNGYVFDERVRGALQTMYDNGDRNAVVFSHGGTIMFWTLMNVNNLTMMEKLQLLQTAQLNNTDYVVIEGNNEDGWTLVNWNGKQFSPEPTFEHEVKLQFRTLSRQLSAAADQVKEAFKTGDFVTIATAINRSMADASFSVTKFSRAINAEIIKRTTKAIPTNTENLQDKVSTGVENIKTSLNAATDSIEQKVQSAPESVSDSTKPADSAPISRAKSKLKTAVDEVVKPRATDLSDGNKALPGVAKPVNRTGEQVQTAVKDAQDRVSSSIKKFGDAVKKATGQSGKTAGDDAGADNDTSGKKDAA
jgi:broad specificity phosphatase PhoE